MTAERRAVCSQECKTGVRQHVKKGQGFNTGRSVTNQYQVRTHPKLPIRTNAGAETCSHYHSHTRSFLGKCYKACPSDSDISIHPNRSLSGFRPFQPIRLLTLCRLRVEIYRQNFSAEGGMSFKTALGSTPRLLSKRLLSERWIEGLLS